MSVVIFEPESDLRVHDAGNGRRHQYIHNARGNGGQRVQHTAEPNEINQQRQQLGPLRVAPDTQTVDTHNTLRMRIGSESSGYLVSRLRQSASFARAA